MDFSGITPPDGYTADDARARQDILTKPQGALGRLEDLSVWVSSCQGVCPPRQFTRARVVVFAGDHGVAQTGVSAFPPEVTAQMVANIDSGGAAINVLAGIGGATVRVVDISVDCAEPLSEQIGAYKVRRGSGNIAVEDAMTEDETIAAVEAGRRIADDEVDAGADLLIAGDMGIGNTTPTAVLIAALTNREPVDLVGRGTGVDDAGWARKTAAVRDALYRAHGVSDPLALLRICGSPDLAAMTGFVAQAALRRTPVLLDGVVVTAAALVADRLAPGARQWWQAGHRSTEPAHSIALADLGLVPIVDLGMRLGEGSGAAVALPILRAAVATLASMATFGEAAVSDRDDAETLALRPQ
jgi:nicotinate-nucleotide--dimethylbenzimidazole phosphoribosyltransferase